jgi:hypothetical protein
MQSFLSNLKNSYNQTLVNMITIIVISLIQDKEAFLNLQYKNVKSVSLCRILSQILIMKSIVIEIHNQQNQAYAINLGWRSRFWFVKWIWKLQRSDDKNHSYPITRVINVGFRSLGFTYGGEHVSFMENLDNPFHCRWKPLKCDWMKRKLLSKKCLDVKSCRQLTTLTTIVCNGNFYKNMSYVRSI